MNLLTLGGILLTHAPLRAGGMAVVDGAMTGNLLIVTGDRVARRDGAQSKRALAHLQLLGQSSNT